jgi:hypothetical protein
VITGRYNEKKLENNNLEQIFMLDTRLYQSQAVLGSVHIGLYSGR